MAGIDRFLQYPSIEMQPESSRLMKRSGWCPLLNGLGVRLFFFNYNGLRIP